MSWRIAGLIVTVPIGLFFGVLAIVAFADFSNLHCLDWPREGWHMIGNCSEAWNIGRLAALIAVLSAFIATLIVAGWLRRKKRLA